MPNYDKTQQLPIYQKAELLFQLVESLAASLPEDNELLQSMKEIMRADAMMLPAKIAGAEAGNIYSIRMQNAAIIRFHAMSLYTQVGGLSLYDESIDTSFTKEYVSQIRSVRNIEIRAQEKGFLEKGVPTVKATEIVNWLKADFDLGHGHANAIYAYFKGKRT